MNNDKLKDTVSVFVNILEYESKQIDKSLIDSKVLYTYLEMPKAKQNDMKKLVPFIFDVDPYEVKVALYKHYGFI